MKLALALLLGMAMSACAKTEPPSTKAPAETAKVVEIAEKVEEPKAIAALRAEVHKRGLVFTIQCFSEGEERFLGIVDTPEIDEAFSRGPYVENGVGPYWSATGPTQTVTAQRLLGLLRHSPNVLPMHKPKEKECPPVIRGN